MRSTVKQRNGLIPITAVAVAQVGSSLLVLTGEGNQLQVLSYDTATLLSLHQVFQSQTIHGIRLQSTNGVDQKSSHQVICLIWGGRCISQVELKVRTDQGEIRVVCESITSELFVDDWIFDACFPHSSFGHCEPETCFFDAAILTSLNTVLLLYSDHNVIFNGLLRSYVVSHSVGPLSVLYSANLIWQDSMTLLVAAGTVFGEVLLWTCQVNNNAPISEGPALGTLLRSFTGHEGSIFGVSISHNSHSLGPNGPRQILASCSDDRCIKIWDISHYSTSSTTAGMVNLSGTISETGIGPQTISTTQRIEELLATATGHSSRIWDLQYIPTTDGSLRLLSVGEDATIKFWRFQRRSGAFDGDIRVVQAYELLLEQTHGYHKGKNIWATSVSTAHNNSSLILSGGADGRLVSFTVSPSEAMPISYSAELSSIGFRQGTELGRPHIHEEGLTARAIFDEMQGVWALRRVLRSAMPTYPSGTFHGKAFLTPRDPTETNYDAELLYSEEGELITDAGFRLMGSRRYVYRYQAASDSISAWFVKNDENAAVDYLFHELRFLGNSDEQYLPDNKDHYATKRAEGYHLCVEDHYTAEYSFEIRHNRRCCWTLNYDVHGPKKKYTTESVYTHIVDDPSSTQSRSKVTQTEGTNNKDIPTKIGTDCFKDYCWIDRNELLATTRDGRVLAGVLKGAEVEWTLTEVIPELQSWSLVGPRADDIIILSGKAGHIYCYSCSAKTIQSLIKLPHKVAFQYIQETNVSPQGNVQLRIVAFCLGSSTAHLLILGGTAGVEVDLHKTISYSAELELPPSFLVTSALFIDSGKLLILGSRNGAMYLCDTNPIAKSAGVAESGVVHQIHAEDAVTSIHIRGSHGVEATEVYLMTTGRDGRYAIHNIQWLRQDGALHLKVITVHESHPPFGPNIEGGVFNARNGDLLLWGFRSKEFVVWNESKQQEIMKVECGGSHRSWSYLTGNDGLSGGSFVWTKASTCNVVVQSEASHQVIKPGGHGREIKAMAAQSSGGILGGSYNLIATGAEDTTIRIFSCHDEDQGANERIKCLATITKHITGIQQLRWSDDGRFLFSAGGYEEFYVWRIREIPYLSIGVVCEYSFPKVTEDGDLRIMDFDAAVVKSGTDAEPPTFLISMVYSDSSVRVCQILTLSALRPALITVTDVDLYCLYASWQGRATLFWLLHFGLPDSSSLSPVRIRSIPYHIKHRWSYSHMADHRPSSSAGDF